MRTEDDLRAALTALECHAPAAARVLPGGERQPAHRPRSPRTVRWVAGAATAAALAGTVTALVLPAASTKSAPTDDTTLRATLLAAFSAASGDVVYASSTAVTTGTSPIAGQSWTYPSQPRPGQLVRIRVRTDDASLPLHSDAEETFTMPATRTDQPPGLIAAKGEEIQINYVDRTWSDQKDTLLQLDNPNSTALIIYDIKTAHWTVRTTTLNGRRALELSWKQSYTGNSWTTHLWVDATTYLPLRETDVFGPPGIVTDSTIDYQYLPATQANLAKLTTTVPAGYKRVYPAPMTGPAKIRRTKIVPAPSATPSVATRPSQ